MNKDRLGAVWSCPALYAMARLGSVWFGMVRYGMANQYKRNSNEIIKEQCLEYLGGKQCCICHTNYLPICCYDFHHSKGIKEEQISKMIQRKSKLDDDLKNELNKCKVVCANCHRQITARILT